MPSASDLCLADFRQDGVFQLSLDGLHRIGGGPGAIQAWRSAEILHGGSCGDHGWRRSGKGGLLLLLNKQQLTSLSMHDRLSWRRGGVQDPPCTAGVAARNCTGLARHWREDKNLRIAAFCVPGGQGPGRNDNSGRMRACIFLVLDKAARPHSVPQAGEANHAGVSVLEDAGFSKVGLREPHDFKSGDVVR